MLVVHRNDQELYDTNLYGEREMGVGFFLAVSKRIAQFLTSDSNITTGYRRSSRLQTILKCMIQLY